MWFRRFKFIHHYLCLDEKEKYDPFGFRDSVITGLEKCDNDFENVSWSSMLYSKAYLYCC